MRSAMLAHPGHRLDPDQQMAISAMNVDKLLAGHEVALDVMHPIFNLAFVLRGSGPGGTDQKTVVQGHFPVGFSQHRVNDQRLQHGRLEIVGHHPPDYPAKVRKSPPVQPNPGRDFLVKHQLRILMTAEGQRCDKDIRRPDPPTGRVKQRDLPTQSRPAFPLQGQYALG
jgi:hypothetical protein